jgi:hypothetical protein
MPKVEFGDLKNYIFGSTAAIITDISLIVGLGSAGTGKAPILGSLFTIALADNISDSLSIHMYKEAEGVGMRLSWQATVLNFLARLLVSLSFVAIVLVFSVAHAIPVAMVWGILLVVILSYWITLSVKLHNKTLEVGKHLLVALIMIVLSRYVGLLIAAHFPQA